MTRMHEAVGAVFRRAVPPARRSRLRRRFAPSKAPKLSVIVPVYNVEAYLQAALESVLNQSMSDLEIIVVDDGSTDRSPEIISEFAARDHRVVPVRQENAGLGAARNAGIARARGEYLTYLDSDDTIPHHAYERMVQTLDETGSDFAIGSVVRFQHGKFIRPNFDKYVHYRDRLRTSIEAFPDAIQDVIACNRMFRADFWRDRIGGFPEGIAYEDHLPMMQAYVRSKRFDILKETTYDWRIREDQSSIAQQKHLLRNLTDRLHVKQLTREMLRAEAAPSVYSTWLGRVIGSDLQTFIPFALDADEEYRAHLRAALLDYMEEADADSWRQVSIFQKLLVWFASRGEWDAVRAVREWFAAASYNPPTTIVDGRLLADRALLPDWADEVPERMLELSGHETRAVTGLSTVRWNGRDSIEVEGWSYVPTVDLSGRESTIRARLIDDEGRPVEELAVARFADAEITRWGNHLHADYAASGFRTTIDLAALMARHPGTGRVALEVEVEVDGVRRIGLVQHYLGGSSAELGTWNLRRARRGARTARPERSDGLGFVIEIGHGAGRVLDVDLPYTRRLIASRGLSVDQVELGSDEFVLDVSARLGLRGSERFVLVAGAVVIEPTAVERRGPTRARLRFPTRISRFGRPELPLPARRYTLRVDEGARLREPARIGERLLARGRIEHLEPGAFRATVAVDQFRGFGIRVSAPHDDAERGRRAQGLLRAEYAEATPEPRDAVLFQSYHGEFATDNPAAIAAELAERDSAPELYWGVKDFSVAVPDGVEAVLINSRRWYALLASARYLCHNIDFDAYFVRRPHQRFLQTFHGHPFKAMGKSAWRAMGDSPERMAERLVRKHADWSAILVGDEESAELYRAEFDYQGEILMTGYPRTDELVRETGERSYDARRVLGIAKDAKVVLFAPTWRESLQTGGWTAKRYEGLDLEALAGMLGEHYVVLARGHNFNARNGSGYANRPQVIDVTNYPEINDLIRAADVAVLDYSSLRFDFAVTGKPMVFFVPDEEEYFRLRPPLFDFTESAPGAITRTIEAAAEAIRAAVAGGEEADRRELESFNRRYNPLADGHASERVVDAFFAAAVDEK